MANNFYDIDLEEDVRDRIAHFHEFDSNFNNDNNNNQQQQQIDSNLNDNNHFVETNNNNNQINTKLAVKVQNVAYSYNKKKPVLKNITLYVPEGKMIL